MKSISVGQIGSSIMIRGMTGMESRCEYDDYEKASL